MARFVSLTRPGSGAVPLVLDSPHSGSDYPEDFRSSAPMHVLRRGEDNYVDDLVSATPSLGATLLLAHFPRPYLDANRTMNDIDPSLIEGSFPTPLAPTRKSEVGRGLIWSRVPPDGHPLYDRLLTIAEVQARIENCWRPYHELLSEEISALRTRFGSVWHVNCHSYPGEFDKVADGRPVDFVIGDGWGKTCDPAFSALFAEALSDFGYKVVMNDPFSGGELGEIYSDRGDNRHSVTLEIARRIYMDPASLEPTLDYPKVKSDLTQVLGRLAAFAASRATTA